MCGVNDTIILNFKLCKSFLSHYKEEYTQTNFVRKVLKFHKIDNKGQSDP